MAASFDTNQKFKNKTKIVENLEKSDFLRQNWKPDEPVYIGQVENQQI